MPPPPEKRERDLIALVALSRMELRTTQGEVMEPIFSHKLPVEGWMQSELLLKTRLALDLTPGAIRKDPHALARNFFPQIKML